MISGGHSQYLIVKDVDSYEQLGTTIDDALGEAFDKTAKMLDLGYPGGPNVEKFSKLGDKDFYKLLGFFKKMLIIFENNKDIYDIDHIQVKKILTRIHKNTNKLLDTFF